MPDTSTTAHSPPDDEADPQAPVESPKRAKFRDLAERRTNNALTAIARIGNLSNRHLYEWNESEVKKIIRALRDEVTAIERRFTTPSRSPEARFRL